YAHFTLRFLHSFPTRRSSDLIDNQISNSFTPIIDKVLRCEPARLKVVTRNEMPPEVIVAPVEEDGWNVMVDQGLQMTMIFPLPRDRKSTRLNSSHVKISYAVF